MSAVFVPHTRPVPHESAATHLRRAVGRDSNPLCRPVDRSRSRLLVAVVPCMVLSVVVATLVALVLLAGMRATERQTALHRHQVTATTVATAVDNPVGTAAQAQAAWAYPQATGRGGVIDVPSGAPVGTRVALWVDDAGSPASRPRPGSELTAAAGIYGLGVLSGLAVLARVGYGARRRVLERRAVRAWEPDWEQVEPVWSGRSRRPGNGER
ncbi:membrane protein [Kitasatospora kazusensis]|uniref:Membrane protein n=1 Tax=Kitasatospora kazusensis TaxID=407974 RepID=A0ABP5LMA8_9ACTN